MWPASARAALASRDLQFKVFHAYLYYWYWPPHTQSDNFSLPQGG